MNDIKETIQGLYALKTHLASKAIEEHGPARESLIGMQKVVDSAVNLLKEHEDLKQKMWNALYAEEDKLEKKFVGTEELHDYWFSVYRPWLQRGFEIAIEVMAEQDGM